MSKLDKIFRIMYKDNEQTLWMSQYKFVEKDNGEKQHLFKFSEDKKDALIFRRDRAKQVAQHFINAMLRANKKVGYSVIIDSPTSKERMENKHAS